MNDLAIQTAVDRLRKVVQDVLCDLPDLKSKVEKTDAGTQHLLNRLLVATDYATGCAVLAEAGLGSPMMTIVRALFENFIGTYWASQTDENTAALMDSAKRELMRIAKLNLNKGHAGIFHINTGQDQTKEFLRDPRLAAAERLPQFAHMAEGAGIRKIYDQLYGALSLLSHASGADILANRNQGEMIRSNLWAAITFLRCLHRILSARINEKRVLSRVEIEEVTKVALA